MRALTVMYASYAAIMLMIVVLNPVERLNPSASTYYVMGLSSWTLRVLLAPLTYYGIIACIIGYSVTNYSYTAFALLGISIAGLMRFLEGGTFKYWDKVQQDPARELMYANVAPIPQSVELMASMAMIISQQRGGGGGVSLILAIIDLSMESAEFLSGWAVLAWWADCLFFNSQGGAPLISV
mmetsp:Transcript_19371/g.45810  ORF Transcript_19371/g.45810 Transcript_19371/m.45810 type:complete len:182 (-) Transcript_19371:523-1068(-)